MAFCAKCGTQFAEGTKFCASCGAPAGAAAGVPATPAAVTGAAMPSNVAGLLTYILGFITGIIFLVVEPYKNDKFVRFHAFQSIFLSVGWIAFRIIWGHIFMGMIWSPFSGLWPLLGLISTLISLGFLACVIFLMYKAYNNERFKLPIIGDMAAKQSG
jgi:uncharacterized membrane protein